MKNETVPELSWLDDPEVFRVGMLPAHSDHIFYDSEESCQNGEKSLYQSLNGQGMRPSGRRSFMRKILILHLFHQ